MCIVRVVNCISVGLIVIYIILVAPALAADLGSLAAPFRCEKVYNYWIIIRRERFVIIFTRCAAKLYFIFLLFMLQSFGAVLAHGWSEYSHKSLDRSIITHHYYWILIIYHLLFFLSPLSFHPRSQQKKTFAGFARETRDWRKNL